MDIQERARQNMNWFERILHKIPGFKGYYEKEFRRDADRLQREFIVTQLHGVKKSLSPVIQAVSRQKNLALLTEYDLLSKSLEKTINEVRYADQGYSGFFDLIKIKEAELDLVYRLDSEMVELACRFSEELSQFGDRPGTEIKPDTLGKYLTQIEALSARRTALLKGYHA